MWRGDSNESISVCYKVTPTAPTTSAGTAFLSTISHHDQTHTYHTPNPPVKPGLLNAHNRTRLIFVEFFPNVARFRAGEFSVLFFTRDDLLLWPHLCMQRSYGRTYTAEQHHRSSNDDNTTTNNNINRRTKKQLAGGLAGYTELLGKQRQILGMTH